MPEEQYDININYDANVDGALDDLDELDDQLGQTEDATEGQGRAATGAASANRDNQAALRSNALPLLTSTLLVAGLGAAVGKLALERTSIGTFFSSLQDGVAGFIQSLVGPEFEQAAQNLSSIATEAQERTNARRESGAVGVDTALRLPASGVSQTLGFLAEDFASQDEQSDPVIGFLKSYVKSITPAALGGQFQLDRPGQNPLPSQASPASSGPGTTVVTGSPISPLPSQISPASNGQTSVTINNNFNGPVTDMQTVEQMAEKGTRDALNNPTTRGSSLTGGSLP